MEKHFAKNDNVGNFFLNFKLGLRYVNRFVTTIFNNRNWIINWFWLVQIDNVWGWASPPLRLTPRSRMGEMVLDRDRERAPSPARLAHTSEKHPRGTLTELNVLRRHRELCDVVLNVGARKIFAHRWFNVNGLNLMFYFLTMSRSLI